MYYLKALPGGWIFRKAPEDWQVRFALMAKTVLPIEASWPTQRGPLLQDAVAVSTALHRLAFSMCNGHSHDLAGTTRLLTSGLPPRVSTSLGVTLSNMLKLRLDSGYCI